MFGKLFRKKTKVEPEVDYIDMTPYRYKIVDIYGRDNDKIAIDIDVDTCWIRKGDRIRIINDYFRVLNIDFIKHRDDFRYQLVLINEKSDLFVE